MSDAIECTSGCKVSVNADLSEASVEDAIAQLRAKHYSAPVLLVVTEDDAFTAGKVCKLFGLQCIVLPREIMQRDSWAVVGAHSHVWSPGA